MHADWIKKHIDDAIVLWHKFKGSALARNAGYLILAAIAAQSGLFNYIFLAIAAKLGLSLPVPETSVWVPITFAVLAVCLLIMDRLVPQHKYIQPTPHPADINLIDLIKGSLLAEHNQYFIRNHDFGNDFPLVRVKSYLTAADTWEGPQYEFVDSDVQAAWAIAFDAVCDFADAVGSYTAPSRTETSWQTVHPTHADRELPSQRTIAEIETLNKTSTEMVRRLDELVRVARVKFGQ